MRKFRSETDRANNNLKHARPQTLHDMVVPQHRGPNIDPQILQS